MTSAPEFLVEVHQNQYLPTGAREGQRSRLTSITIIASGD